MENQFPDQIVFHDFLLSADFFFKTNVFKNYFQDCNQYSAVGIKTWPYVLLGQILV